MKVVILTPNEMTAFLTAVDRDWLPFFAISAFTGLRSQEVGRLDWNEINSDRSIIDLPFEKSKNGNRKLEEIPANLLPILTPFARAEGPVMPRKKLAHAMVNGARDAGIVWKQNCLRHSFCSYAVALKGLDWTAMQADHSTQTLRKNYLEVVSKEEAAKYWATKPSVVLGEMPKEMVKKFSSAKRKARETNSEVVADLTAAIETPETTAALTEPTPALQPADLKVETPAPTKAKKAANAVKPKADPATLFATFKATKMVNPFRRRSATLSGSMQSPRPRSSKTSRPEPECRSATKRIFRVLSGGA